MITLCEVGPRDGLQNEEICLDVETRRQLVHKLYDCGLHYQEVGAMVSPKRVPAMADSEAVLDGLDGLQHLRSSVLIPNFAGWQRLRRLPTEIAVFTAASETFCQKNTHCSMDESLQRIAAVMQAATVPVRGYISCCFGCPYEGEIDPSAVIRLAETLHEMGCANIALGDTIGTGTQKTLAAIIKPLGESIGLQHLSGHFHDTYGQGLANLALALDWGVQTFDVAIAGLGGCPYARSASGNLATEDALYFLHGQGLCLDINLQQAVETGTWIAQQLGKHPHSRTNLALQNKRKSQ